jgi:hypothetical protein
MEVESILERHPDWPKLNVSFYFSPHGTKKDFEGIPERLANTDIYLYENASESFNAYIQNHVVDNPTMPADDLVRKLGINGKSVEGTIWEPMMRGLYGTKKAIGPI